VYAHSIRHDLCLDKVVQLINELVMARSTIFVIAFLFPNVVAAQISIGSALPDLPLESMQGGSDLTTHALVGVRGAVFVFWSNDCNWTSQYEERVEALVTTGVAVILVNSNDPEVFPKEAEAGKQYNLTYVRDPQGGLARALGAERTPHVFAFDNTNKLVYVGGIDDAPADPQVAQAHWIQDVVQQLASGQEVNISSTKPFGCRIKLP